MDSYATVKTQTVEADNGITYAYRDLGEDSAAQPLVLLQHFRGNLDNWDPALVDTLAAGRRVITFDNRGVGATTGTAPNTVAAMAEDAIAFITALGLTTVDLLGFSLGSFVAQEIALIRPNLVRRIVLASAAPQGASGIHGWSPDVVAAVGGQTASAEGYVSIFFTKPENATAAGRVFGTRTEGHDAPVTWPTVTAQYDAITRWGIPNHALLQRVQGITQPVFVANGDSDPMILPRYTHLLAGLLPDATTKIYPDAAHGFLFQHHEQFAADVAAFLDR
ncbi:alpha/beta hydrolase [Actinospica sp. MGRD01-02]|uniref:Alpha/beta hydrolase n=1 Tax=Actinospica acidithermotolerans TaxID=2828514 RepID=A0A941IIU7_9ACTN|nr:alpha/beta hydrolase [Actinospica acidithermotolerans]MBR7825116.1 alpha/beta hydrolase [Actinospica acidithermotolerans]